MNTNESNASHRVGVDVGGTFTDFCVFDEAAGTMRSLKTLSTPDTPGAEVMNGIAELERRHGQRPARSTTSRTAPRSG